MGPLAWIGLIVLGIAIHWTINLTFTSNPTFGGSQNQFGNRSLPQYALYVIAWLFILIGIVWPVTVSSFGFGIGSLLILGMIVHVHRQRESQALLWLLGVAMRNGIPVSRMARAFGQERCDELGTRAHQFAAMIDKGVSLQDALRAARYRLPAQVQLAVDLDASRQETGELLNEETMPQINIEFETHPHMHQVFYFANLVLIAVGMLSFLAVKVLPVLVQILDDFDVPRNRSLEIVMGGFQGVANYAWLTIGFWLVTNLLMLVFTLHYLGWIRWEPFFIRRLTRRHHASIILRSLASQVRNQRPIHASIELMSEKYPQRHIRTRLEEAAARIRRGQPWQEALRTRTLINQGDASLLLAAERVGNLPWALEEIGLGIARRLKYRLTLWMRIVMPLLVIAMAIVIGICGTSVFLALRDLVLSIA